MARPDAFAKLRGWRFLRLPDVRPALPAEHGRVRFLALAAAIRNVTGPRPAEREDIRLGARGKIVVPIEPDGSAVRVMGENFADPVAGLQALAAGDRHTLVALRAERSVECAPARDPGVPEEIGQEIFGAVERPREIRHRIVLFDQDPAGVLPPRPTLGREPGGPDDDREAVRGKREPLFSAFARPRRLEP